MEYSSTFLQLFSMAWLATIGYGMVPKWMAYDDNFHLFQCEDNYVLAPGPIWKNTFYTGTQLLLLSGITYRAVGGKAGYVDRLQVNTLFARCPECYDQLFQCVEADRIIRLCPLGTKNISFPETDRRRCGYVLPCNSENVVCPSRDGCTLKIQGRLMYIYMYNNPQRYLETSGFMRTFTGLNAGQRDSLENFLDLQSYFVEHFLLGFRVFSEHQVPPALDDWDLTSCRFEEEVGNGGTGIQTGTQTTGTPTPDPFIPAVIPSETPGIGPPLLPTTTPNIPETTTPDYYDDNGRASGVDYDSYDDNYYDDYYENSNSDEGHVGGIPNSNEDDENEMEKHGGEKDVAKEGTTSENNVGLIAGSVIGGIVLFHIILLFACLIRRKSRKSSPSSLDEQVKPGDESGAAAPSALYAQSIESQPSQSRYTDTLTGRYYPGAEYSDLNEGVMSIGYGVQRTVVEEETGEAQVEYATVDLNKKRRQSGLFIVENDQYVNNRQVQESRVEPNSNIREQLQIILNKKS